MSEIKTPWKKLQNKDYGDPYAYNLAAREGKLTLPHVWRGRNLRIFRADLLDACGVKGDA